MHSNSGHRVYTTLEFEVNLIYKIYFHRIVCFGLIFGDIIQCQFIFTKIYQVPLGSRDNGRRKIGDNIIEDLCHCKEYAKDSLKVT